MTAVQLYLIPVKDLPERRKFQMCTDLEIQHLWSSNLTTACMAYKMETLERNMIVHKNNNLSHIWHKQAQSEEGRGMHNRSRDNTKWAVQYLCLLRITVHLNTSNITVTTLLFKVPTE